MMESTDSYISLLHSHSGSRSRFGVSHQTILKPLGHGAVCLSLIFWSVTPNNTQALGHGAVCLLLIFGVSHQTIFKPLVMVRFVCC